MTSFVCLLSFVLADVNAEMMTGLHTLTAGMIASAWLLFGASVLSAETLQRFTSRRAVEDLSKWNADATLYAVLAAACGIAFALRPGLQSPSSAWWPIVSLLALSGLFAAVHSQTSKRTSLLVAFAVFNVAGGFWWLSYVSDRFQGITAYLLGTIIIVSLSGLVCLLLELRLTLARENLSLKGLAVHDLAALLSVFAMSCLVVTGLLFSSGESFV